MRILTDLAYLSDSADDFPLDEPKNSFMRVKYPDSFKASLAQLCNEGYQVFNLAYVAMDDVRLVTLSIPGDIKFVVRTLMKGDDYEVVKNLHLALAAIDNALMTCSLRGEEVQAKVETTNEMFSNTQEQYFETNKNLLETNKMLNQSLVDISKLDASTTSLKAVRFMEF